MRLRVSFLPTFFISLAVVVAVIAYVRIRSYEPSPARAIVETPQPKPPEVPPAPPLVSRPSSFVVRPSESVDRPSSFVPRPSQIEGKPSPPPASTAVTNPPKAEGRTPKAETAPPATKDEGRRTKDDAPRPQMAPSTPRPNREPQPEPEKEKDLSSDNIPPRLVSIEFVPPQVQDGQETILRIEAIDDLAGVRSVSGTIIAPSGAVQGFACTREGETTRYQSRVLVPKAAADGVWRVNYLAMTDHANNTASLSQANAMLPPTASFRVVSAESDSKGPTLVGVWLERRSMQSGEKNTLTVQAEDDKSGVHLVSGVFQSPSRTARIGFICRNRESGKWECDVTAPACADCGDWRLEQLQLQDKANNMTTVRLDNPILAPVLLDISSAQCDATPPAIEHVAIDRKVVTKGTGPSIVSVTVTLTDDTCGIQSVSGQVVGPPGPEGAPSNSFSFTQDRDARTWVGRFNVPPLAAKGMWRVSWLQVLDRGRNLRTYSQNDPVLADATFVVE
jgi:hypothetical protein